MESECPCSRPRGERNNMQYILNGFTNDMGFRVFAFDGIGANRTRTGYTVRADLALVRKYGIRLQELPLLCRGVLERLVVPQEQHTFTYTEADMVIHADACAAEIAGRKKKPPRRNRQAEMPESV